MRLARVRGGFAAALLVGGLFAASSAMADGDYFPPVKDPLVIKECAACHMAFPAGMLPARSWTVMMAGLSDHFGENAALDAETARKIEDYLVANAAGAGRDRGKPLRGLKPNDTPQRISELPWFIREHGKDIAQKSRQNPKVKTVANCVACHENAAKGYFEDD
ncbi:MAG: cytochrome C [Methylacidiphilales bacterium]|nr:cytochrome C [Candidatus Methylacidiphilales bacterium]